MATLRNDFLEQWSQSRFGFAEGSKWKKHIGTDTWEQESEYLTFHQILKKGAGNRKAARKKRDTAKALGRGKNVPGKYKGYYYDKSRGENVFLYSSNMKHIGRDVKEKGFQTKQKTGQANILSENRLMLGMRIAHATTSCIRVCVCVCV